VVGFEDLRFSRRRRSSGRFATAKGGGRDSAMEHRQKKGEQRYGGAPARARAGGLGIRYVYPDQRGIGLFSNSLMEVKPS